ncbi:MAG: hypothetical protein KJZ69_01245 [Phycisphaerales bacterium]|nr:hypothetical protein [Phycisphaerales bacterium]
MSLHASSRRVGRVLGAAALAIMLLGSSAVAGGCSSSSHIYYRGSYGRSIHHRDHSYRHHHHYRHWHHHGPGCRCRACRW